MPKFSVIVPIYKVEKYIEQCMDSIVNQTYSDFEVLAVDDCGYDNSMQIVEDYAKKDSRIKILKHERNRGLAAARNTALDAANGEYIVCLDSDDWMELNCLETLLYYFETKNTNSIWFNAYKFYDDTQTRGDAPFANQQEEYRTLTPDNMAAYPDFTWIKAYTRESIQKYNICWPEGLTFEDGEFYFKYFTLNPLTYVLRDCLINYRYREGSIVREADKGNVKMEDIYTVVEHLKDFWIEQGIYEKYKTTILKLIQNRIRMCKGLNYSKKYQKLSYDFLQKMGYPEAFEKFKNANNNPLVSVVVPFYNVEKYIDECLNSIVNQTYKNIEIICVDDCGQDNSLQIVEKYASNDNRIKIIHHEHNMGYCPAVNTGIENATGEYVFFVESDDFIEKDCIEIVTNKLIETNFDTVMFKIDRLETDGIRYSYHRWAYEYASMPEGSFYMTPSNMNNFPYFYWNKGYKREFLLKENVKWRNGGVYEDQEFFYRVFTNSPQTYMIDRSFYVYRIRESSLMGESFGKLKRVEQLFSVMKRIYDYLNESNLYNNYKESFCNLIYNNLKWYRQYFKDNAKFSKQTLQFFNEVNI